MNSFPTFSPMNVSFYFKYSQTLRLKNDGYGAVYYYVMYNGKSREKSTEIKCNVAQWDKHKQELIGPEFERDNKRLKMIKQVIEKNKDICDVLMQAVTANELVEMTTVCNRFKKTFMEVLQEFKAEKLPKIRLEGQLKSLSNIEKSTYNSYLKHEKNIIKYLNHTNKLQILCSDIDARFCELFDNYLTQNGCGQAYATKNVKLVQAVMVFAQATKTITVNFTQSFKAKTIKRKKVETLKYAEIEMIRNSSHLFSDTEQKYIDVFLFMNETIMHVGDYLELTAAHFEYYENGQVWLRKPRVKRQEENNQIQLLPLSETAIAILQKYAGIENMPKAAAQTMSKYLKMACAKAGIGRNVSLKMGRSAGISYKYNKLKMREHSIAIAAGWTSTAQLKDYLEIDYNDFRNEFLGEQS